MQHGADPKESETELWKRLVFNLLISNTDDHLRNHGFILLKDGWHLSPLYDVNPVPYGDELSLNITYDSANMSLESAVETAPFYDIARGEAERIIKEMSHIIMQNWERLAKKYHITNVSIEYMRPAFTLAAEAAS